MTTRPHFPHAIDSTLVSTFRSCPQKFFRSYIQHYKPKGESVHLIAGGAFAKGLEVARKAFYEDGQPSADSIGLGIQALMQAYGDFECPPDSAKSLERTIGALEFYFEAYPLERDKPLQFAGGKHAIEFSFAEPLPILHPETGDPLLYCGRSDMIAEFGGGTYIFDDKTASQLGASWPKQWELRSQFTGYAWACKRAGVDQKGALVRGVSILKSKYDTLQAVTYRPDWEIERWYAQVLRDIKRMLTCWEEGYWDFNLDHACAEYGGCAFVPICKSPAPDDWLSMYFTRKVWDPLSRREMTPEEYEAEWQLKPAPQPLK